jgi:GT2 family glycosyltransferase
LTLPTLYLITVNYYAADLIAQLWESIEPQAELGTTVHLVIVNNSAADDLSEFQDTRIHVLTAPANLGFGAACNLGLQWVFERDRSAIAWLINPDARLTAGATDTAIHLLTAHPEWSIIGTLVEEPDGKLWFGGGRFNRQTGAITTADLFANTTADYMACDWVTGCSLLLNLRRFSHCPAFDRAYFLYYEDFDFCQRYQQQGHSVGITRQIRVMHQPSSVTDRAPALKLKYSTASYLLTLERYTSKLTQGWRFGRLLLYALLLLPLRPTRAIGKLQGVWLYGVNHRGGSTAD